MLDNVRFIEKDDPKMMSLERHIFYVNKVENLVVPDECVLR